MADVKVGVSPSTGQHFVKLPGNLVREVTAEQAAQIQADPGMVSNILGSALDTTKSLLLGGASMILPGEYDRQLAQQQLQPVQQSLQAREFASPVSTAVGSMLPQAAADIGAFAVGGLPLAAAVGAAGGAAASPEEPFVGAAIGGALGALPGAPTAAQRGVQAAGRIAPGLGTSLGNAVESIPIVGQRMADRTLEKLARVDAETTAASPKTPERMLSGYFSPDELNAQGIPITRGDAMALYARNADEFEAARKVRNTEELQRSGPAGSNVESIRAQQRVATTDYIARQIDPENTGLLTDTKMGQVFNTLGKQFDEINVKAGDIEGWMVTPKGGKSALETTLDNLKLVADNAADSSAAQLNKIVAQYEKAVADGSFRLKTFNDIDRQLGNMVDAGMRQGDFAKLSDAGTMRSALRELQEKVLSDADKIALKEARRKYALASALIRPGSRNAAGEINIGALRNAWNLNPSYSKKNIAQDDLGRALETAAFLQQRIAPSSGTAERLIANAPNTAANLAGKAATGLAIGAGVAGFNSLLQ